MYFSSWKYVENHFHISRKGQKLSISYLKAQLSDISDLPDVRPGWDKPYTFYWVSLFSLNIKLLLFSLTFCLLIIQNKKVHVWVTSGLCLVSRIFFIIPSLTINCADPHLKIPRLLVSHLPVSLGVTKCFHGRSGTKRQMLQKYHSHT